jgi:exopolyphosphatase/guanosine-5'-triphosphate,3'-diphosphate pyrophosphatase
VRVAVVDVGTNSTRLLVADVGPDGAVTEVDRRTTVTRLGEGVDANGVLAGPAIARVHATLATYRAAIDALAVDAATAVMTSAVRDARNGPEFAAGVRERFGLDARTLGGDEEARLTFRGATSERPLGGRAGRRSVVVVDIGGGSTELVVGAGGAVTFHASAQAGVVRQTERFVRADPPAPHELRALTADAHAIFRAAVPGRARHGVTAGIAVAGTATSCAAMLQELDPYDAARVHGFRLARGDVEALLDRLAALPLARRREVTGLHPDRAPVIVTGIVLLLEAMSTFALQEIEASEHDILRGAALELVRDAAGQTRAEVLARPARE